MTLTSVKNGFKNWQKLKYDYGKKANTNII
jgi:hypothetical protein